MRKKIDIEIVESEAELQRMIRNEQGRLKLHRLSALFLFKTGQAKTYSAIGKLLGYERHTISMWFNKYKEGGLEQLLIVDKPGPKEKTKITGDVLEKLRAKIEDEQHQFRSYKEIQQWLNETCDLDLSYSTVHSIVRYELEYDLKAIKREQIQMEAGTFVGISTFH
jgi:transposase